MRETLTPLLGRRVTLLVPLAIEARHFIVRPRRVEQRLQLLERTRAHLSPLPAIDHEPHRPVEHGHLALRERTRHLLRQLQARDTDVRAVDLFDIIVDLDVAIAHGGARWQRVVLRTLRARTQCLQVCRKIEIGLLELRERVDGGEPLLIQRRQVRLAQARELAARLPPCGAYGIDDPEVVLHGEVPRLAARERIREHLPRLVLTPCRKFLDRFDLALQLEAEVLQLATEHQRRLPALAVIHHRGVVACCVFPEDVHRDLRPLDPRARIAELVREVAQLARDRAPASTHAALADARLLAPRGLLVDHEIERHVLGEQLREQSTRPLVRHRHLGG